MINSQKHKKTLKKISFQGNDLEIFSDDKDSYFDKYLNEILYLFENCGADNIVFEDMDRYNTNHIFEKLREINDLINKRNPSREQPLRFLYLLRDDIFNNKDRTKFFDYIIPVVPVIDGSNSINKFLSIFKDAGIVNQFTEAFLNDLSLYVDDMRILKNVCNEYIIYTEQISEIELDKDKLLAILVYKNLFPKDYNALQLRKGYVYNLFEQRYRLCKAEIEKIEMRMREIENLLELAKQEMLEDVDELDAILLPWNFEIYLIAGTRLRNNLSRVEIIKQVKANPDSVYYRTGSGGSSQLNVADLLSILENSPRYIERRSVIEKKENEKSNALKDEVQSLKQQKLVLQSQRLKDIIPYVNEQDVFSISFKNLYLKDSKEEFDEVKSNDYFSLIIYLVRNGYIDESYNDYMTYFYSESITANDKNFLKSVADHKKKEYAYPLDAPSRVLSRLQSINFTHIEVLNFDLIDELLKNVHEYKDHVIALIKQLEETKSFDFIVAYRESGKDNERFIQVVNHYWPKVFECVINDSDFTDSQKKQYAIDTLYYSPVADIKNMNPGNHLSFYIAANPTFLDIQEPLFNRIIDGIKLLKIKFTTIEYASSDIDLFNEVYKNNMYIFSPRNILAMLHNVYDIDGEDDEIIRNSFSSIFSRPQEPLVKYVETKIEDYLCTVLDLCQERITDDETTALMILNHNDIEELEHKEVYIRYLQRPISNINEVADKRLWPVLLDAQIALFSENNILDYYFHSGQNLDTYLISFINAKIFEQCSFRRGEIEKNYGENAWGSFAFSIIKCNDIKNEQYKIIVESLGISYTSFKQTDINLDKISILIDLNVIPMSQDELLFTREKYEEEIIHYIVHNIDKYMDKVINGDYFDHDEMLSLLLEPISEDYKIKMLEFASNKISVRNMDYSSAVVKHILENNYDSDDLKFLIYSFKTATEDIRDIVIDKCIKNVGVVMVIEVVLHERLYDALINHDQINTDNKVELLATQILALSIKDVRASLNSMGLGLYNGLFERKQAVVNDEARNTRILEILETRGWHFKSEIQRDGKIRLFGKAIK